MKNYEVENAAMIKQRALGGIASQIAARFTS